MWANIRNAPIKQPYFGLTRALLVPTLTKSGVAVRNERIDSIARHSPPAPGDPVIAAAPATTANQAERVEPSGAERRRSPRFPHRSTAHLFMLPSGRLSKPI